MKSPLDSYKPIASNILKKLIKDKPPEYYMDPIYDEVMVFAVTMALNKFKNRVTDIPPQDKDLKKAFFKFYSYKETINVFRIEAISKRYKERYLSIDSKKLKKLANLIMENKSIVIVGAGISFNSNFGGTLDEHLYYCLREKGHNVNTQIKRRDDNEKWLEYWVQLSNDTEAAECFKEKIKKIVTEKEPNYNHAFLSGLFGTGFFTHILCLNWDDLLKRAYDKVKKSYNLPIKFNRIVIEKNDASKLQNSIWKVHGCVSDNEFPFIFPGSSRVSNGLKEIFSDSSRSEIVLICGTSLSDTAVVDFINGHLAFRSKYWIEPYASPLEKDVFKKCKTIDESTAEILCKKGIDTVDKLYNSNLEDLVGLDIEEDLAEDIIAECKKKYSGIQKIILPASIVFKFLCWWMREQSYRKQDLEKLEAICSNKDIFQPEKEPDLLWDLLNDYNIQICK